MASEGEFPKVDGDIVYGSEASRFGRAGGWYGSIGSITLGSGAGFQNVGSIVIGAGSLTNPCAIKSYISCGGMGGGANAWGLQISGTDAGGNTSFQTNNLAATANAIFVAEGLITDIVNTTIVGRFDTGANNSTSTVNTAFATINPTSGLVVFITARVSNTIGIDNGIVTFDRNSV